MYLYFHYSCLFEYLYPIREFNVFFLSTNNSENRLVRYLKFEITPPEKSSELHHWIRTLFDVDAYKILTFDTQRLN